jgi:hypothetical protein
MTNQDKTIQSEPLKNNSENPQLFNNSGSVLATAHQNNPSNSDNPTNKPSSTIGGPQFGLESQGGWKDKFRGWINKYGSSVILPIIALAILAGGIYLYANQKSEQANLFPEENLASIQEQLPDSEEGSPVSPSQEISQITEQETEEALIEKIIPEGRKEGGMIIEKAVKGDGVTHLARRALKDYLKDHSQELTNEQKIHIEDYLKDRIGSRPLEIDEEITFSEDLIKEAIDASLELTPEQLKNLEKYSALVAW